MVAWSSLKYAVAATCATGLMQAVALPTTAHRDGTLDISSGPYNLFRRQQVNVITFPGVQQGLGPAQGQVPLRKEIREMIQNPTEFNLFLLALQRFYQLPQTDDRSYYGIAGIHGRPFKAWDGVRGSGDQQSGYCTHKDVLFLSWHRPYLALYEQLIWEHARDIANEFPEPKKSAFKAVLPTLRIPFWDWAVNSTIPREVGDMENIEVDSPKGRTTIPNPLYSYKFSSISEFSDVSSPLGKLTETVRYPEIVDGAFISQIGPLNNVMENAAGALTNRVYRILMTYKDYNGVSTGIYNRRTGRVADSLEGVHDDIHNAIGGPIGGPTGHMADISLAAFDPIFWLHHTNIDRLFALWQGINPTGYNISGTSSFGTFTLAGGIEENLDTPLTPFRKSANSFYTSANVASTKQFGYSYAEIVDWDVPASTSPQEQANRVMAAVNRIYGQDTPTGTISTALTIPVPKGSNAIVEPSNPSLNSPPSAQSVARFKQNIVEGGKYNEWTAEILVNQAALDGAFRVYLFLGDASPDQSTWDTSKNLIGTYSVLKGKIQDQIVRGAVPLTSALLHKIIAEEIKNLRQETVVPYLLKNLKCKVAVAGTGKVVEIAGVKDLKVSISAAAVTLPKTASELPKWDSPEVVVDLIDVAKGVVKPGLV
ncbi:hypothetical protein DRE_01021 [Drechslerella stenobrocha 248]|uniref:tyrosinase n=1 Tax=Drechslerella stenobrocha 248 TaxID=1043628 RepID=W7HXW7_9PEZI|nr:hypothetical protein DRE_01021 [Drechslerella stenobrocha 248]